MRGVSFRADQFHLGCLPTDGRRDKAFRWRVLASHGHHTGNGLHLVGGQSRHL